jgi:hypothetical protein
MPDGAAGRINRADQFEPNDLPRRAPLLSPGSWQGLEISPPPNFVTEDLDWFAVPLLAGGETSAAGHGEHDDQQGSGQRGSRSRGHVAVTRAVPDRFPVPRFPGAAH